MCQGKQLSFRSWDLGIGVNGSGFRDWSLQSRVQGHNFYTSSGYTVQSFWNKIQPLVRYQVLRVWGLGYFAKPSKASSLLMASQCRTCGVRWGISILSVILGKYLIGIR